MAREGEERGGRGEDCTANLRTKILDFRGFDPSGILMTRDGIPTSTGNSQETLSQRILVGRILAGRLGAVACRPARSWTKINKS